GSEIRKGQTLAFLEAMKPEFKAYQHQVILNARAMAKEFIEQGIKIVSGGTDNHLMVLDLTFLGLEARKVQNELEELGIYVNRNAIPGDQRPPFNPSGLRLGSPAITTRGLKEKEARIVAGLVAKFLKNPADKKIKNEIKKAVSRLVKEFSIYEDFKY
ncbi:MAG: serine hydroxymethyltransferase, partial [Patescibacteria group bacterium]